MRGILDNAIQEGAGTVIHNGDVFEEKNCIPVTVYNAVWSLFKEYSNKGLRFIFNTGNHDMLTKTSDSSLQPFSDIVQVISDPTEIDEHIMIVPHGIANYIEGGVLIPPPDVENPILFLHEDISGLIYGDTDFEPERIALNSDALLKAGWSYIFNGHIHKPQEIGNLINVGSITRQDWGEADQDKRYIYYNNGIIKSMPIECPKFITYPELNDDAVYDITDNNFYRFDISADQVNRDIFKKWNVSYRIIKHTTGRETRLQDSNSVDDDVNEYIKITDTPLDKDKLKTIGKELVGEI
jgi:DNA repair exonuclease SbcCD nuclease subunit